MEIEEEQPEEEEEEEEERGGENKSVRKYVTVEIKSDIPALFDDSRDDDFEKKRKIRIDAKKTVKDLKVDASKRLISSSLNKPTNPKYICFLYQGKVLKEDEETLENALGLNREKLRYLSSSDEEDLLDEERRRGNERKEDEDEVKIVHMIVRKSNRELEREREEREKRRLEARETSDDNRSRSSNVDRNVLASAQPNATSTPQQQQQQQVQQQVQQSPPPGAVMVSPMVINAYNAAYNAAFRSLRPNATVIPRSPGLAYVQTNAALEQSTFFQRQENVTSQIGGSGASGTNVAGATADAAPNVPQGAEALGAALARANNNNNPDIDFDPNQPYQRIVRRGEDGEEIVEVIRVIQFRIDLKLMFKLILITAFACQDASRKKMAMYITAAVIGYLYQTGVLESVWDALFGAYLPPENEAQQGGGADARANNNNNNNNNNARDEGNNNNNNRNNIRNGRRQRYRRPPHVAGYTDAMPQSWFGELKIFAYSFLASLFPAWRVPNLQQQQQQRLQNEQNNDNNNPQRHLHQD